MTRPRLSIVIPTRNRAVLLRHALRSALDQTEVDLEVIVHDNASADDTAAVVSELDDGRVRYHRTDRALAAHDNWEAGLSHARGEWVTLLPDDDGFVPRLAERVWPLVEGHGLRAVAWGECTYAHPELRAPWLEGAEINRLVVEPHTGRAEEVGGREELERIFRRRERRLAPGVVTAFVRRDAIEALRTVSGRVFGAPDPFLRSAAVLLTIEPTYLAVDLPLTARGISGATITHSFLRNERDGHDVVREFDGSSPFEEVPLRSRTSANVIAESLLRVKKEHPERFDGIALDPVAYFVSVADELADPRRREDGGAAQDEWRRVLAVQPAAVRAGVWRELTRARMRRAARRVAGRIAPLRGLRRGIRRHLEGRTELAVFAGADHGFDDLPGAVRFLDEQVLPAPAALPDAAGVAG